MLVSASLIFQGSEISTLCDDINVALSLGGSRAFKIAVRRLSLIFGVYVLLKHVASGNQL